MPFQEIETDEQFVERAGTDAAIWAEAYAKMPHDREYPDKLLPRLQAWFQAAIDAGRRDGLDTAKAFAPRPEEVNAPAPQSIETAPKEGGWILAHVLKDALDTLYHQPWRILTWSDSGWIDDDGGQFEPVEWIPLPDPQPANTGWTSPNGTIRIEEITGEGWTCNGKPLPVPWRWMIYIQKADGSYDEYRDTFHEVTIEQAQKQAAKWHAQFGLPVVLVPLDRQVVPFRGDRP